MGTVSKLETLYTEGGVFHTFGSTIGTRATGCTRFRVKTGFRMSDRSPSGTAPSLRTVLACALFMAIAVPGAATAAFQLQTIQRELPELAPPGDDALAEELAEGRLDEAEYALERALAIHRPERARRLYGYVARPDPREGTIILRDLAARVPELSPRERKIARRILARPTDRGDAIHAYRASARRACGKRMCFWWVQKTSDRPALVDRNRNGIPDWVDRTRRVFGRVWSKQVGQLGYRAPKSDRRSKNRGPNGKLDIYIADVGAKGLYGYCTSDDPARRRSRSVSAYCVVDNNFARRQFGGGATGIRALRVTAAHEFFHAVQYSYDWREDLWLMEGTATWMEDEIFNGINDNRQYLKTSPLSPERFWYPLDYYTPNPGSADANYKYGVWIFWRYLSERYGRNIVRAVWRRADARGSAPNEYSLQAVASVMRARGENFADVLSDFGVANVFPALSYREGAFYPSPGFTRAFKVSAAGVGRTRVPMFHLANDYYAFEPNGVDPAATLTISLELPPAVTSPRASVLVQAADGTLGRVPAQFDPAANAWRIDVTDFGSLQRAILVLTNGSTRYRCWRGSVFSCRGTPRDDVDFFFQASVSQ